MPKVEICKGANLYESYELVKELESGNTGIKLIDRKACLIVRSVIDEESQTFFNRCFQEHRNAITERMALDAILNKNREVDDFEWDFAFSFVVFDREGTVIGGFGKYFTNARNTRFHVPGMQLDDLDLLLTQDGYEKHFEACAILAKRVQTLFDKFLQ